MRPPARSFGNTASTSICPTCRTRAIGWSSCVGDPETGRIYVQGVCGYFCCLEGDTGKLVWDRSLHEEFGLISTYGGRTNVPVVFEDTVLISAVIVGWGDEPKWGGLARPAHRFMCFDKATGELRWLNGTGISPYDTTYSTPTVMPARRPAGDGVRLGRRRRVGVAAADRQADLELSARRVRASMCRRWWRPTAACTSATPRRTRSATRRAAWSRWTARRRAI